MNKLVINKTPKFHKNHGTQDLLLSNHHSSHGTIRQITTSWTIEHGKETSYYSEVCLHQNVKKNSGPALYTSYTENTE